MLLLLRDENCGRKGIRRGLYSRERRGAKADIPVGTDQEDRPGNDVRGITSDPKNGVTKVLILTVISDCGNKLRRDPLC